MSTAARISSDLGILLIPVVLVNSRKRAVPAVLVLSFSDCEETSRSTEKKVPSVEDIDRGAIQDKGNRNTINAKLFKPITLQIRPYTQILHFN